MKQILPLLFLFLFTLPILASKALPLADYNGGDEIHLVQSAEDRNDPIKLFPNPASDYIRIANGEEVKNVLIINIVGKTILSFQNIDASKKLNVSSMNPGLYLVRLMDENHRVVKTLRLSKR